MHTFEKTNFFETFETQIKIGNESMQIEKKDTKS